MMFQDDKALGHKKKETITLKNQQKINSFPMWPMQSPDLSLIESIQVYIQDRLYQTRYTLRTKEVTWRETLKIWEDIELNYIHNFYNSKNDRMSRMVVI